MTCRQLLKGRHLPLPLHLLLLLLLVLLLQVPHQGEGAESTMSQQPYLQL
jgi:hypothetical protein